MFKTEPLRHIWPVTSPVALVGKSNTTNLVTLLDAVVSIVTSGATVPLDNVNTLPRMFPGLSCCSIK